MSLESIKSEIHCSQDPIFFLSLISVFFKLGVATDHGLREDYLWLAAAVARCYFHQVYLSFSKSSGSPTAHSGILLSSHFAAQGYGAVQLEANGRSITAAIPECPEVRGYQLSDVSRNASAQRYTDLPLCKS
jgi:hypothetical protein